MGLRRWDVSETDIARAAVAELQVHGYETHEEVSDGKRADIVGLRGALVVIVECKVSMSLALLAQCLDWRGRAHMVIAACGFSRPNEAVDCLVRHEGLGHWEVIRDYNEVYGVRERHAPRFLRRIGEGRSIRRRCSNETRTGGEYAAAGSQGGGYYSPFRATCKSLRRVVEQTPGIALKDALHSMSTHYASRSSALSSLPGLIRRGVVDGVRCTVEDRRLLLYPDGSKSGVLLGGRQ